MSRGFAENFLHLNKRILNVIRKKKSTFASFLDIADLQFAQTKKI
jgi:hypothetical protein